MKLNPIVSAVIALGSLAASGLAHADLYPDFVVNASGYTGTTGTKITTPFTADKITGNYVEVITFGVNTFNLSLKFNAGQFVSNDGTNPLTAAQTGLGSQYGLYALFQGMGNYSTVGGVTTFTLSQNSSTFNLYIDPKLDTTFTTPLTATGFTTANASDDVKIASGVGQSGSGNVSCTTGNNCGSFGQTTSFNLVNPAPAGGAFFIAPQPFYSLSMQSGQFNGFAVAPGATQTLNGSMDVIFATVPEPSSLALVGAAFIGIGAVARRKKV